MTKNTFEDWLKTGSNIAATKENFTLFDWLKIQEYRRKVINDSVRKEYDRLMEDFERGLSKSSIEDEYIDLIIEELKYAIKDTHTGGKSHNSDLEDLSQYFKKNEFLGGISIKMPYPELPDTEEVRKAVLAQAYINLYYHLLSLKEGNVSEIKGVKDALTTKQQMLLIYYLNENKLINLRQFHQDQTKQALVLSSLMRRSKSNIRTHLNRISQDKYRGIYFTKENLKAILLIIEKLDRPEISDKIKEEIRLIELRPSNI